MRKRETILLTGFGPFPGVPENISGQLALCLAELAQKHFPDHRAVAHILPTEWAFALDHLQLLYAREKPSVALHFGVSERAQGLVVETVAQNVRSPRLDAAGCLPATATVVEDGPARLTASLPVDDILRRVGSLGIPVRRSEDAGTYLCNAVLYRALMLASMSEMPLTAGFIHIPPVLGEHSGQGTPLDWNMALAGGLEIVGACLGRETQADPQVQTALLRDAS